MDRKNSIGRVDKVMLWITFVEINLMVVSENITKVNPVINVNSLSFWYLEFSFELIISNKGIKDSMGI